MEQIKFRTINIETLTAIFIIAFVSIFILANFFIGFSWSIYLLAMSVAFVLSIFYPRSGLYAIVFLTMIFERFFTLAPIYLNRAEYKLYPIDIIILAIILNLVFSILNKIFFQKTKNQFQKCKLVGNDWVLLFFILINLIYFLASIFITKTDIHLSFSTFKNYSFYSLLYFISFMLIQRREDLKRLFHFFLAGAVAIIGFIIFGIIKGEGLWTQFTPLSTPGTRILAFTHGFYLSLALIAVIVYLITKKDKSNFFYFYTLIPLWLVGIIGTMMRHLWISIILALAVIYKFISKKERKFFRKISINYTLITGVLLIFVFYFMSLAPNSQMTSSAGNMIEDLGKRGVSIARAKTDESFTWRELVWKASYVKFKKHPILGIGTGKLIYVQTQNYQNYIEARNIHNSFLAVMLQTGLLGLGILVFFIYKNMRNLVKSFKNKKNQFYALSILGVLTIYILSSLFQPYLETNLLAIFFWIALGLSRNLANQNIKFRTYENFRNQ